MRFIREKPFRVIFARVIVLLVKLIYRVLQVYFTNLKTKVLLNVFYFLQYLRYGLMKKKKFLFFYQRNCCKFLVFSNGYNYYLCHNTTKENTF